MSGPRCRPVLPQDLVWEILSLLPVKALVRFKCVCKSWNSFVSEPAFVKLHLQRSSTNTSILYTLFDGETCSVHCCSIERLLEDPSSTVRDDDLPLELMQLEAIVGVCNGLVCLRSMTVEDGLVKFWVRFWNPATRLTSEKPCIQSHSHTYLREINVKMGFGYDASRDTYIVVALVVNEESLETEVRVHCLGDNCSRKVVSWSGFPILRANGQYVSGTLNWIAEVGTSSHVIYSFDLRNETYRYLLLPGGLNIIIRNFTQDLGILRGCLCLFQCKEGTHLSVWQMKEFGIVESWTLLLNVSCEHLQISDYTYWQFPLCMSQNGDILFFLVNDIGFDFEVLMYSQRDNRLEQIKIHNVYLVVFFDYVQSLVLPY